MKLTAAQIAAIAAGASAEVVASLAAVADLTPEQIAAQAAEAGRIQAEEAAAAETARLAAEAEATRLQAEADTAAALAAAGTPNPVVAHLTGQLAEAQAATLAAEIKAANYKAAADAQEGLLAIARASLSNMNIALGGSAAAADTFTAATIAAEHQRLDAVFKSKFRIGGVAAVVAPGEKAHAVDPMFAAAAKSFPSN